MKGSAIMEKGLPQKAENVEVLEKPLIFEDVYDDGCYFWFSECDYNALFRVNKANLKAELMGVFPDECFMRERLYSSVAMCDGKLFFAPYAANEIAEYDLQKRSFRKISVNSPRKNYNRLWKENGFFNIFAINHKVYFIPDRYPGILCYDTKKDTVALFDDWVDEIERLRFSAGGYFWGAEISGSKLALPCVCADAVVMFDTESGISKVINTSLEERRHRYIAIVNAQDYFYLISTEGKIVKRKLESEKEEVKEILPPDAETGKIVFYPTRCADGYVYLFPFEGKRGVKIDIRTDQVIREMLLESEVELTGRNFPFLMSMYHDGTLYSVTGNSRYLIKYDFDENRMDGMRLFSSETDRRRLKEYKKREFIERLEKECITEDDAYPLVYMLTALRSNNNRRGREKQGILKGNEIYYILMKDRGLQFKRHTKGT